MKLQIFLALLVPALSGLAYLAYKHPKAYEKLFSKLYLLATVLFAILFSWDSGIWISNIKLKEKMNNVDKELIQSILEPLQIPYWWLIGCYSAFIVYLLFLSYLSRLIEENETKK